MRDKVTVRGLVKGQDESKGVEDEVREEPSGWTRKKRISGNEWPDRHDDSGGVHQGFKGDRQKCEIEVLRR